MENLSAKLEKLLTEAENCDLIGRHASDHNKRELFKRLAHDLRQMTRNIEAVIATRAEVGGASAGGPTPVQDEARPSAPSLSRSVC